MAVIISCQFGNGYQRRAPGHILLSRVYASPRYLWLTEVEESASLGVEDPLLEGCVRYGQPAEFAIGLPDGKYHVTLTCFEPTGDHGPFAIKSGSDELLRGLVVPAATVRRESFDAHATDGVLRLQFVPAPGRDFLVNGIVVEGPEGVAPQPIFTSAPPPTLPTRDELAADSECDPAVALRRICDWLVEHRRADGFIGDAWAVANCPWYTVSMPTRALLAGYGILGDGRAIPPPRWRKRSRT